MELKEKTFIVTGGDNEIGKELILLLLAQECRVIAVNYKETVSQIGINRDSLTILNADITDEKSVKALYEQSLSAYGTIDGIINNAGTTQSAQKLNECSFETIKRVFDLNYFSTLYLSKIFLPHLLSRPEAGFVISTGFSPSISQTTYKYGTSSSFKMLIEGLRSELLDTAIKVTLVSLGADFADHQNYSPLDAAQAIITGIEKEASCIDITQKTKHNHHPNLILQKIRKRVGQLFHQL